LRRPCDRCGEREAVVRIESLNESICDKCLSLRIWRRVKPVLDKEVQDGDVIASALSGGKDSSLALYYLWKYKKKSDKDFGIFAITIDEGTSYRAESISKAKQLTSRLGVKHKIVKMSEIFAFSIPQVQILISKSRVKRDLCTYCGVFRRQVLNIVAREEGATKVATGHNLDDMVQTLFMNLIRGDMSAMARLFSKSQSTKKLIPRIRPLVKVPEKEVAVQALLLEIPAHFGKCPLVSGMRVRVRRLLDHFEQENPGFKERAFNFIEKLAKQAIPELTYHFELKYCKLCGEPTTQELCKVCQFKQELETEILPTAD